MDHFFRVVGVNTRLNVISSTCVDLYAASRSDKAGRRWLQRQWAGDAIEH